MQEVAKRDAAVAKELQELREKARADLAARAAIREAVEAAEAEKAEQEGQKEEVAVPTETQEEIAYETPEVRMDLGWISGIPIAFIVSGN